MHQHPKITEAAGSREVGQCREPCPAIVGRCGERTGGKRIGGERTGKEVRQFTVRPDREGLPARRSVNGRWAGTPDGLQTQLLQQPALGHVADGGQTGLFSRPLYSREIDLGGNVLPAGIHQRRVGLSVIAVGNEGAVAALVRVVQVAGSAPVIDGEREARLQRERYGVGPGIQLQADFGSLPILQRDFSLGQPLRKQWRGRFASTLDQDPLVTVGDVGCDVYIQLAELMLLHANAVDGQSVQQLVGQDAAGYVPNRQAQGICDDAVGIVQAVFPSAVFPSSVSPSVADDVPHGSGKPRRQPGGGGQDVSTQQAIPGAGFDHDEGRGSSQQCPALKQLHRQQCAEGGMNLGTGVVVIQRVAVHTRVISTGPVQGARHVLGEGNRPAAGDAAPNQAFRQSGSVYAGGDQED